MSKYRNKPQRFDGIYFDSGAELTRYHELKLLLNQGVIQDLVVHPVFVLIESFKYKGKKIRAIHYEADFAYVENGETIIEDVKGVETAVFKLKHKLFLWKYPNLELRVIKR